MATGNQLMKEISDQFLVCKMCQEPFKEPKTLSCLHTFCCACVQQQYDSESSSSRSTSTRYTSLYATRAVTCPVCRKKTELPTGGVRRLPDNFLVSNLTDVLAKRRCIAKVPPCEICHTVRSRSCDACSKCLDCDKLLCRACVDLHSSTKVTRGHSLIDLEGQKDIECKAHPEETVRFYCERCEECICVVCTFQEHKDHDVCSFNDGFSKHKASLEGLLSRSKERIEDVSRRLNVIDKVETLSRELKERIRDLAISYTSQVRAREKELIRQVDEVLGHGWGEDGGGGGSLEPTTTTTTGAQLAERKAWLQERLDSLQSTANLTEIVVRDKGVEMLLLKKEIQGKMEHLLSGALPPEPRDLSQLNLTFVPGEVKLGDVFLPGEKEKEEEKNRKKRDILKQNNAEKKDAVNGFSAGDVSSSTSLSNGGKTLPQDGSGTSENVVTNSAPQPCRACLKRKRQEERDEKRIREGKRERRLSTRSICIQTIVQGPVADKDQVSQEAAMTSSSTVGSFCKAAHNHILSSSSALLNTDEVRVSPPSPSRRARGTMTARGDVRTLKVQTEDSCLRDSHLEQAAACGSSFPNTGGAIAAAFLKHRPSDEDVALTRSWPVDDGGREGLVSSPFVTPRKQTCHAEVSTDISLGVSSRSAAHIISSLQQGEGVVMGGGLSVTGSDIGKPDLLAETGMIAASHLTTSASSSSSTSSLSSPNPWIRSRKVQTEISALDPLPGASGEGQCIIDDSMMRAVFVNSSGASPLSQSAPASVKDSLPLPSRPPSCDIGVMTPFKVKVVQDTADRHTATEAVTSQAVSVMTSPNTRTVYIQTLMKKLRSTGASTDYQGQMSKGVGTVPVTAMDADTATPPVTQESAMTWTEPVMTSERATSATGPETSDAVTLTTQLTTTSFAAQVKPASGDAFTSTGPAPAVMSHTTQASPATACTGTVPDTSHLPPHLQQTPGVSSIFSSQPFPVNGLDTAASSLEPGKTVSCPPTSGGDAISLDFSKSAAAGREEASLLSSGSLSFSGSTGGGGVPVVGQDRSTVTVSTRLVTVATGPSSPMMACRTTSTDTANLLQVSEKETSTWRVKMVDEWTHTPQPQLMTTGVSPYRPAHMEVGVTTSPVTLMDQATLTEVRTFRDSGTESGLVVRDSETLTEVTQRYDAQTAAEVMTECQSTSMDASTTMMMMCQTDGSCMTEEDLPKEEEEGGPPPPHVKTCDSEVQCQSPRLVTRDTNTTRYRRKVKEVQTPFSYMECVLCRHPEKMLQLEAESSKTFTDTSTDPSPPDTQDVATMALSCLASPPGGLVHTAIQTSAAELYDKGTATSFDFDEELAEAASRSSRPLLECQDAATSTESLPYIGLLSEIDVDELIVIPEAHFELVSDSEEDAVSMVDGETLTEVLDYVEVGTQTLLLPMAGGGAGVASSSEHAPPLFPCCHMQDDLINKHLVSVGVNTVPKVTFEKETCTPIRHLFSKGTMTFFVAKMDKATSTISTLPRQGALSGGSHRAVKEARGHRVATDTKVTMTPRTELRDMAVETDSSLVDGRITHCISKLRSVSQRLNSPTLRKASAEGEALFFGQSFYSQRSSSSLGSPTSPPQYLSSPTMPTRDINAFVPSPPARDVSAEEAHRQTQLRNLLVETDSVLKSKESSSPTQRKAQPITTLKPRSPGESPQGDVSGSYASKSFPRPRSLERQNRVKMGSQATSPSRLPLSRYNSAPGRIATVPAQTLFLKTGQTSPRVSPSRIPVCQKPATITISSPTSDGGGGIVQDSEPHPTSPTQKIQQRPSLPSISETRTPSSCSETSCVSIEFEDSSLKPVAPSADSSGAHSRSPSNVTSVSDAGSETLQAKGSAETLSADCRESNEDDSSSACSASAALTAGPTPGTNASSPSGSGSPGKQKKGKKEKEKKGFMQRFLPGKKKKDAGSSEQEREGLAKSTTDGGPPQEAKQQQTAAPASPRVQKKQTPDVKEQKGNKKKKANKSGAAVASSPPVVEAESPAVSRPSSLVDSAQPTLVKGQAVAPVAVPEGSAVDGPPPPALPPHHYPPLPDPSKSPPPPRKPQPFVYVRQRLMSIQQDNVEELKEKEKEEKKKREEITKEERELDEGAVAVREEAKEKDDKDEKEKEEEKKDQRKDEKEKGKEKVNDEAKVAGHSSAVNDSDKKTRYSGKKTKDSDIKTKESDKSKTKEEKIKGKTSMSLLGSSSKAAAAVTPKAKDSKVVEKGTGGAEKVRKAPEKGTGSKPGKSEGKEKKEEGKSRMGLWLRGK